MKILRFYCQSQGCQKSFRSEDQLTRHSLIHRIEQDEEEEKLLFECEVCNVKFPTKRSVSAHRRIHLNIISKKIINLLTSRLSDPDLLSYEISSVPYSEEDIVLRPISETPAAEVSKIPNFFDDCLH